jgi:hypothetical protein
MIRFGETKVAIVCGGRDYRDSERVNRVLDAAVARLGIEAIVQGVADGADYLAWQWADARDFPCGSFPANWKEHGRRAGPIRNQTMLDEAKPFCVIAFPGGRGTDDMKQRAREAGVPVYEC